MIEIWKDILGYEGIYQVSNLGRIKSLARKVGKTTVKECVVNNKPSKNGYVVVQFYKDRSAKAHNVHRVVASHFISNPNNYKVVNHINSIRSDNRVDNLEWCTQSYNLYHSYKNGRNRPVMPKGKDSKFSKAVILYKEDGSFSKHFHSLRDVSKFFGKDHIGNISSVLTGKRKSIYGYKLKQA